MAITGFTTLSLDSANGGSTAGATTTAAELGSLSFSSRTVTSNPNNGFNTVYLQYNNGSSWVTIATQSNVTRNADTNLTFSVNVTVVGTTSTSSVSQQTVDFFKARNGENVQFRLSNVSTGTPTVTTAASFAFDTTADSTPAAQVAVDTGGDGTVTNAEAASLKLTLSGIDADAATVQVRFSYNGTIVTKTLVKSGGSFNGDHFVDVRDLNLGANAQVTTTLLVTDASGNALTKSGPTFQGVICFFPGTLIATPEGERAVETLARGELVLTAEGKAVPVRWVGRQTVATRFADPLRALPVRIRAGALGGSLPKRDLLVSPGHALLVDGILATAAALVNGTSILREDAVPEIFTYFHVELADQSLILAEGAPAETFLDDAERAAFDNWAEHEAMHDGTPVRELDLPRATSQRQLPAATRQRLAEIAARLCATVAAAA